MTAEEYRNYLETDFDDVDLKELKDIRKIRIERNIETIWSRISVM